MNQTSAARACAWRRLCGAGAVGEALLRFSVGFAMVPHGLRMCLGYFKGTGGPISSVPAVAAMYDRKGFQPGWFWAYCTVLTQFVAAPCVALGLFTRPMALPLFLLMALSAYDHGKYDGWFWNKMGFEYPAMWAIAVLYFLVNGGGLISLDHLLGFEFKETPGLCRLHSAAEVSGTIMADLARARTICRNRGMRASSTRSAMWRCAIRPSPTAT